MHIDTVLVVGCNVKHGLLCAVPHLKIVLIYKNILTKHSRLNYYEVQGAVMLISNHVLSGAVIGSLCQNAPEAFVAGLVSHFLLDSIPHWNAGAQEKYIAIAKTDGTFGLVAVATILAVTPKKRRRRVLAGMLGSCLPDIDKPSEYFFGKNPVPKKIQKIHGQIQIEHNNLFFVEVCAAVVFSTIVVGTFYQEKSN